MQFHWNMTISVGDVLAALSMCGTLAMSVIAVLRRLDRVLSLLKDFPPHRHVGEEVLYPNGFEPGVIEAGHRRTS